MTLKSKIEKIFIENTSVFEAMPAGVRIPKRLDPDDPDYEDEEGSLRETIKGYFKI